MKPIYTLILTNQQATLYRKNVQQWEVEKLNGDECNFVNTPADIRELLQVFNKLINRSKQLADIELHILAAADQRHLLPELLTQLMALSCTDYQVLQWEKLLHKAIIIKPAGDEAKAHSNQKWLSKTLLPLLEKTFSYSQETLQELEAMRKHEEAQHEESMESLRNERQMLQNECTALKQQVAALQQQDMEPLLTYLPIIYRNFWNSLKPSDVALLAGSYQIPTIPSPFPEPSSHTILQKKKQLHALPAAEKQRLRNFCHHLPHDLDIRPDMRFFFSENE